MDNIEQQIKDFLIEMNNKYKDIISNNNLGCIAYKITKEYENYLLPIMNQIDLLPIETFQELTHYAVNLSKDFKDPSVGWLFWYHFGYVLRY